MGLNRYGEQSHTPFRNRRLYSANGQWFFDTREGKQFGPYRDQRETQKALALFVAQNLHALKENSLDNHGIDHGVQDGIEYMVEELMSFFRFRRQYGDTATLIWANNRLKVLMGNKIDTPEKKERIDALKYAIDNE